MPSPGLWLPGWASRFKAKHSGHPGYAVLPGGSVWHDWFGRLPEACAPTALQLNATAQGAVTAQGQAAIGVQVDAVATGWTLRLGAATLNPAVSPLAVGWQLPQGAASWTIAIAIQAIGLNPLPGAMVILAGPQPLSFQCQTIQGFHRPLGGEVASLTLTVARSQLFPEWLEAPPLGQAARIEYNGAWLMSGYLYAVSITSTAIELRIEG